MMVTDSIWLLLTRGPRGRPDDEQVHLHTDEPGHELGEPIKPALRKSRREGQGELAALRAALRGLPLERVA